MASTDVIHFNADTAERPDEFEVFTAVVGDKTLRITDPADIDYQDLLQCETPLEFFKYAMSQEDRDHLANTRLKSWRLNLLLEAYLKHYRASERVDKDVRAKLGF